MLSLAIGTEYFLFGGAGVVTLLAFTGLILAPAIGAYGRTGEKATPALPRAAARALGASVALIDRSSAVLGVAASSQAEERKLLAGEEGVVSSELRVADTVVGELRYRARGDAPGAGVTRMVSTLLAL